MKLKTYSCLAWCSIWKPLTSSIRSFIVVKFHPKIDDETKKAGYRLVWALSVLLSTLFISPCRRFEVGDVKFDEALGATQFQDIESQSHIRESGKTSLELFFCGPKLLTCLKHWNNLLDSAKFFESLEFSVQGSFSHHPGPRWCWSHDHCYVAAQHSQFSTSKCGFQPFGVAPLRCAAEMKSQCWTVSWQF